MAITISRCSSGDNAFFAAPETDGKKQGRGMLPIGSFAIRSTGNVPFDGRAGILCLECASIALRSSSNPD